MNFEKQKSVDSAPEENNKTRVVEANLAERAAKTQALIGEAQNENNWGEAVKLQKEIAALYTAKEIISRNGLEGAVEFYRQQAEFHLNRIKDPNITEQLRDEARQRLQRAQEMLNLLLPAENQIKS